MSTFACPVVRIGGFGKHKNADTLCITQIEGSTCIFKQGAFQKGDLALFVPIEAVVPFGRPCFDWLRDPKKPNQTEYRVKAKRLRGVFSDGFLTPLAELGYGTNIRVKGDDIEIEGDDGVVTTLKFGQDLSVELGITKAVDELPVHMGADQEAGPDGVPVYDIEPWKKYKHIFNDPGELVVITEKLHGTNARFAYRDGRLFVGSRNRFVKDSERNLWWAAAREHSLEEKLRDNQDLAVFGEIYGVQDLKYDCEPGKYKFAVFDVYDTKARRYLDYEDVVTFCFKNNLPQVPVLYTGTIGDGTIVEKLTNPAEGEAPYTSTLAGCIREGVVVKPQIGRWNEETNRTILKHVSQAYLLRKGGTEAQ